MSRFVDPSGESTYGLALCARCSRKFKLAELRPDANYPNLMVCPEDSDQYDPYRLAPRAEDQVVLPFNRPDSSVSVAGIGVAPALTVSADGQRFLFNID
jgi:hypothetical protein